MAATICILGTLDTKGEEFRFVRDCIAAAGLATLVVDAGVLGPPAFEPDVPRSRVAAAGGRSLSDLAAERDRGKSIATMAAGAAVVVRELFDQGRIDGIIALGGSAGTTIGTSAMRALPIGFPKVMASTLASGDTRPYVGTKDIAMLYSVVDIAGLNRLSRRILSNAAAAVCGMVGTTPQEAGPVCVADATGRADRPLIAATMFGVTTPCVTKARQVLEQNGYEVLVFHATGSGGRAMEDLIADGFVAGVLDVTTTELADELVGGVLSAGPNRLEAAGAQGIPQVVCPGAVDMVNFGPMDTVPEQFRHRNLYVHNPTVTLMRTTVEECASLGRITAEKLNRAKGPVAVVLPLKGVSAVDAEGGPFYAPDADVAYNKALKDALDPRIPVVEIDSHINDDPFAQKVADLLLEMLKKPKT